MYILFPSTILIYVVSELFIKVFHVIWPRIIYIYNFLLIHDEEYFVNQLCLLLSCPSKAKTWVLIVNFVIPVSCKFLEFIIIFNVLLCLKLVKSIILKVNVDWWIFWTCSVRIPISYNLYKVLEVILIGWFGCQVLL